MIKVGFPIVGGAGWTGGINYLINLFNVLEEHACGVIEPRIFVRSGADLTAIAEIPELLKHAPIIVGGSRRRSLFDSVVLLQDKRLERVLRGAGIDLVFQHSVWLGMRFSLPTLTWIPDFQHRHLPRMFGWGRYLKRELGYRALTNSATLMMLSSEDARRDCEKFYPAARGKTVAVPFAVSAAPCASADDIDALRQRYGLPERFFFLPNQLWKHKNHRLVVEAVAQLRSQGTDINVIASGGLTDSRDPGFPRSVLDEVERRNLKENIRFLGLVPRTDVPVLMQASMAVINPSLFEGWSTVVEEAKSLGVRLILSDLAVHREQAPAQATYFNPYDHNSLVQRLMEVWEPQQITQCNSHYLSAAKDYGSSRLLYAQNFATACEEAMRRWR